MFFCKFWEIYKNTFFKEQLRATAPEKHFKEFFEFN